jgi:ParB family chromosome partitioning protein
MKDAPQLIPIGSLRPHPDNPRLLKREDIISAIEQQIRAAGSFDVRHAITVRPLNGNYQIIAGHNRTEAAGRAGQNQIPAWIREMDDETAFMELILSNEQSELSPLERGMHALGATEKGKHGRSIAAYAEKVGRKEPSVNSEIRAARVASSQTSVNFAELLRKCSLLVEIHAAPQACWPALVDQMMKHGWTVKKIAEMVAEIRAVKSPRGYEKLFPKDRLQDVLAGGEKIGDLTRRLIHD